MAETNIVIIGESCVVRLEEEERSSSLLVHCTWSVRYYKGKIIS